MEELNENKYLTEDGMLKCEPDGALRYEDSDIDFRILRAIQEMGFEAMTPIQEQAIPVLLEGKDVIGVGKIYDIFEGQGVTETYPNQGNEKNMEKTI